MKKEKPPQKGSTLKRERQKKKERKTTPRDLERCSCRRFPSEQRAHAAGPHADLSRLERPELQGMVPRAARQALVRLWALGPGPPGLVTWPGQNWEGTR